MGSWTYLVETTLEPTFSLSAIVPFLVDDPKSNILIWWAGNKANKACIIFASGGKGLATFPAILAFDFVRRSFCLVNEIWVEDIEFVALDDLGWRIVVIIMRLVVLVPFVAHLDTIEVTGLPGVIFASPLRFCGSDLFFASEYLLAFLNSSGYFSLV